MVKPLFESTLKMNVKLVQRFIDKSNMQNMGKILLERKEAVESQNSILLVTVLNSNECLIIKKESP